MIKFRGSIEGLVDCDSHRIFNVLKRSQESSLLRSFFSGKGREKEKMKEGYTHPFCILFLSECNSLKALTTSHKVVFTPLLLLRLSIV